MGLWATKVVWLMWRQYRNHVLWTVSRAKSCRTPHVRVGSRDFIVGKWEFIEMIKTNARTQIWVYWPQKYVPFIVIVGWSIVYDLRLLISNFKHTKKKWWEFGLWCWANSGHWDHELNQFSEYLKYLLYRQVECFVCVCKVFSLCSLLILAACSVITGCNVYYGI